MAGAADPDEFPIIIVEVRPIEDSYVDAGPVELQLVGNGSLRVEVMVLAAASPSSAGNELEPILKAFCAERKSEFNSLWSYEDDEIIYYLAKVSILGRDKTVDDAYQVASDIYHFSQQVADREFSAASVLGIIRGGRVDLLLGQYESHWLECKSVDYDLEKAADKIELSQDVARFANSETGGVLLVGVGTKRDALGDRLNAIHPLQSPPRAARYHKVLDRLIFPPIEGLRVEAVPARPDGQPSLLAIQIPPQPEELKPFLVTGAIVRGKVEGAFISIVRRREEHSIPITAAAIHSLLSVGQAFLRRGEIPASEISEASPPSRAQAKY
jgi:hypothetical protein